MFKFLSNLTLLSLLSLSLISCSKDDDPSPIENNYNENLKANISLNTHYGANGLEYVFEFWALEEDVLTAEGYQFKFDLYNDGIIEQDWSDSSSYRKIFNQPGEISMKLDVRSSSGQIVSCSAKANVIFNITPPHDLPHYQREAVWAKDGSNRLLFVWQDYIGSGLHEIFIVDYPNGNIQQITSGTESKCKHYPEWSADGSKVYYTYENTISSIDVNSKAINVLIDSVYKCMSIACSKDGSYLYFCGNVGFEYGLFKYTFADSKLEKISDFNKWPITLSPDGTKIAAGYYQLSIFDLNQLQVTKTYDTQIKEDRIEWSPNGRYITLNYVDTLSSIRILDLQDDSYDYVKVTGLNEITSWGYTWSEDGSMLAFLGTHPEKTHTSIWGVKPNLD